MYVKTYELMPGDVFSGEGLKALKVTTVEVSPPGCRNRVHINDSACFERMEVRVLNADSRK